MKLDFAASHRRLLSVTSGIKQPGRKPLNIWLALGIILSGIGSARGQVVAPRITTQPSDAAIAVGATLTLRVAATGTPPMGWQWSQDNADLAGATNSTLTLRLVQLTDAGGYSVLVTNSSGAVTSRIAQVSVAGGWSFTNTQGTRHPYRLFLPPKYNPGTKYPLVLFWHGSGEVGTDNLAQLKDNGEFSFLTASNLAKFPCFFLAPQMPSFPNSATEANAILDWATNLFSHLQEQYSIDADRLYVTGLSMGGFSTWAMLARYPGLLAAAVPMSGGWYWNNSPDFARSLQVPVWNFHAADDNVVPVSGSDSAVSVLRTAGARIIYTRYQSGGHGIWPVGYSSPALMDWIMAQKRGTVSVSEPFLCITNPPGAESYYTGTTNLGLAGTAAAGGQAILSVIWKNMAGSRTGLAAGTNVWAVAGIPLLLNRTNPIVVTASTTSWAAVNGGNTTFNCTLSAIQSPLQAFLSVQGANATLNWTGGGGPYRVQRATDLIVGYWTDLVSNATAPVLLPRPPAPQAAFYRVVGQ